MKEGEDIPQGRPEPGEPSSTSLAARMLAAGLAALALFITEQCLELVSGHEALSFRAGLSLLGTLWLLQLSLSCLALVATLAGEQLARAMRKPMFAPRLGESVAGLLCVPIFLWAATALTSGDWISQQSWAGLVRWGSMLGAVPVAAGGWLLLAHPPVGGSKGKQRGLLALSAGLAALFIAGDRAVEPGLHPPMHFVALLGGSFCILVLFTRLIAASPRAQVRAPRRLTIGASALTLVVVVGTLWTWTGMPMRVKAELALRSPIAANLLALGPQAPPPPYLHQALERMDPAQPDFDRERDDTRPDASQALADARDFNVILIVVDTLRADALAPHHAGGRFDAVETPFLDEWSKSAFRFRHAYASATRTDHSMPSMFRSIYATRHPEAQGRPLATHMRGLGRTPIAAVNNFFIEPRFEQSQHLLEGFERIAIYTKLEMQAQFSVTAPVLESVRDEPFFAWLHYYSMHSPGYDGAVLGKEDGSWTKRYKRSLVWLDTNLARLWAELDRLGLTQNTIVVIASDHGEGLGNNGVKKHGITAFEEEVRVPLWIRIPGMQGGDIDGVVGNIDIVPTLTALLGGPASSGHRGRSLLPDMLGTSAPDLPYLIESRSGKIGGVVIGRDKLIFDTRRGITFRFDLVADPKEKFNLYAPEAALDQTLMSALVFRRPDLFAEEFTDPETLELLIKCLREIDVRAPSQQLRALLAYAALSKDEGAIEAGLDVFERSESDKVKFAVVQALEDSARRQVHRMTAAQLKGRKNKPSELGFVRGLAQVHAAAFSRKYVAKRMRWWVTHKAPSTWGPWLSLVQDWKGKPPTAMVTNHALMLSHLGPEGKKRNPAILDLALQSTASLAGRVKGKVQRGRLRTAVEPFADHERTLARIFAINALAQLRAKEMVPDFTERAGNPKLDARERQAALRAVAKLDKVASIPTIARLGREPVLTFDAIKLMERIGHSDGLEFLDWVASEHGNSMVRKRASKAAARVRRKVKVKAKGKAKNKNKNKANPTPKDESQAVPQATSD